ncbi:MAG: tetratricopeptide repeat protein [Sulfuritalea sp.]|jgi:tetratricopeptide (TPR) repeat protein|nr:tetratricopeptide repeat protein [Sulfuritalea sp.]
MSLLMDALKKAELAKRQGQGEGAGGSTGTEVGGGIALEPIAGSSTTEPVAPATENASSAGNLPHLPSHLEELDAQFLAEARQSAAAHLKSLSPVPAREPLADMPAATQIQPQAAAAEPRRTLTEREASQNQSAAQNVFAAKQAAKPPARKVFAVAIGVLTLLAACGIGGYFWWQLQPKSFLVASRAPLPPPPTAASVALSSPAAVSPAPTFAAPPVAPVAAQAPAQARRATAAPAALPEPESPIRVARAPLKVNPALIRGFDAFNRGDLALAQIEYEQAQKADPRNTDALHGLAAIALRQGRTDQAEWLYRQITEADPHDTVAMAALINMRGQIDPNAAESRLKSLSADQPELAAPHFSLGNLYARHGRWNEAQQAYFRAYSAEPDNPDIIYNLAISLEHLRQNKLAAQYYSQAIAAAQTRPAGFDLAQATARLNTLQP